MEQEILEQNTKIVAKSLVVETVLNSATCPSHKRIPIELSLKYFGYNVTVFCFDVKLMPQQNVTQDNVCENKCPRNSNMREEINKLI